MEILDIVKEAVSTISDKKGENVTALDVSGLTPIADYFIIATGNNPNHVKTISDAAEEKLEQLGLVLKHKEGRQTCSWILLDFSSIIVHIFGKEEREFYNLEHIWADADKV